MKTTPDPDTVRLWHGPYTAPKLQKGDRAFCHLRDGIVVVSRSAPRRTSRRG